MIWNGISTCRDVHPKKMGRLKTSQSREKTKLNRDFCFALLCTAGRDAGWPNVIRFAWRLQAALPGPVGALVAPGKSLDKGAAGGKSAPPPHYPPRVLSPPSCIGMLHCLFIYPMREWPNNSTELRNTAWYQVSCWGPNIFRALGA